MSLFFKVNYRGDDINDNYIIFLSSYYGFYLYIALVSFKNTINMKNQIILMIFLFGFFVSCSDDNSLEIKSDPFIQVKAFYNIGNANDKHLDVNSKVFVYYGKCLWGIADYELKDDGRFVSRDGTDVISPEQQGVIRDIDGVNFKLLYLDKEITVFVKSSYGNMLSGTCYPSVSDSAQLVCNFSY